MKTNYIKNILFVLMIILSSNIFANSPESEIKPDSLTIDYIRTNFYSAIEDEEKLLQLENFIKEKFSSQINSYPPIVLAYYGGLEALKAQFTFNPFSKLSYLNTSLDALSEAINKSPNNLEIHFLRFSILDHLPWFLGHSAERESDMNVIIELLKGKNFSQLSYNIQAGIIEYMISSGRLSTEQEKELRDLKISLAENE